ncbi:two-component system response regulator [uncultured Actinomyces sp.]|uniref:two-component system response regulator n=1 Tax=uncultured Actinomyces sp. TaxID=249061 RepID=UPI00260DCCB6|nr:two-component system response regulator [uncultured Actinomyces sp.]
MSQTDEKDTNKILLYSDNSEFRANVIEAVGIRPGAGMPKVEWVESATEEGAVLKYKEGDFDLLILDGETQKVGAMALLRRLEVEFDNLPPSITILARQQDSWIAKFSGTTKMLYYPIDPIELQQTVTQLLS